MNTVLALFTINSICYVVSAVLLILAIIFFGGRFYQSKQDTFVERIKEEFPGCKVTDKDDLDEIRIIYFDQPLIVTKGSDGALHSEPYEPDVTEALAP